jgi:hypothetical protein
MPSFLPETTRPVRRGLSLALGIAAAFALVFVTATPLGHAAAPAGWNIVNSAPTDPTDNVLLMGTTCTSSWNCWAVGGSFTDLNNGQPVALFEHWNGTSWSVQNDSGPAGTQASLVWGVTCVTASDCWAVGAQQPNGNTNAPESLTEHWDGSTWSEFDAPNPDGYLFSVSCVTTSDCWAAGTNVDPTSSDPTNGVIDHWDGSTWSVVQTQPSGQPYDQFNSVTCTNASNCWAVGFAGPNQAQNGFVPNVAPNVSDANAFIEHWDGTGWTMTSAPWAAAPLGTYLDGVTCTSSSNCLAVGTNLDANGDPSTSLVAQWGGSQWTAVPSADSATGSDILSDVTCLDATDCWAVGADGVQSGQSQQSQPSQAASQVRPRLQWGGVNTGAHESPHGLGGGNQNPTAFIESWNGSTWSVDPTPNVTAMSYLNGVACARGSGCFADGFAVTGGGNGNGQIDPLEEQLILPPSSSQGLTVSGSDGGVFTFGAATFYGSLGGTHLNAPIVGMADTPDGGGYWLVARDGGVFTFGDAGFYGALGGTHLNAPIVGMATTPDGGGYWLVGSDGGVFSGGDATFYGSLGGTHLNAPIVGMAATPDGGGYWLVASDGGVFTFGDATFEGALGGTHLNAAIVGMAPTPDGLGYWLVASDGGVFSGGDAAYAGSLPAQGILHAAPVMGMAVTPDGNGYWLIGSDGAVYSYGDATFLGSLSGVRLAGPLRSVASQG